MLAVERLEGLQKSLKASEQRAQNLEWKVEELQSENRGLRQARWGTEDLLRREVAQLELRVANLTEKLEAAEKQLVWFRNTKFNKTSEKDGANGAATQSTNQSSQKHKPESPLETEPAKNPGQQPGSKGHGRSDRSEVDTKVKYLTIPGGCACGVCGQAYLLLPRTEASPLTEYEAAVVRTVFQRCIYVSQCKCEGRKIKVADPPAKLFARTEIGNSLWVHLIVQKFLHGMPTNRCLKELSLYGFHLSAGTVTGGFHIINDLLAPLEQELIDHCRGADLWNADETIWRVFGEGKQRWWLWLVASHDTVVYLLDPSRSKRVPAEFFAGSVGVLMTDRLASYKSLQASIRKAWCLVHLRRDLLNVFKGITKLKDWAKNWLTDIGTLFALNHKRFKLWQAGQTTGSVWQKAVEELEAHVQKLQEHWQQELKQPKLHKEQAKILRSMERHWAGYTLFLEDPRIGTCQ